MSYLVEPKPLERMLVYDYARGEVIDVLTGEVVDRIYVYEPMRKTEDGDRVIDIEPIQVYDEIHPLYVSQTVYELLVDVLNLYRSAKEMLPIYGISEHLLEMTLRYYLKKLKRHEHTNAFKAGLLYVALEQHGVIVDDADFAYATGVEISELKSAILDIKGKLAGVVKRISFDARAVELIKYFSRKFGAPNHVAVDAINVYNNCKLENKHSPKSQALASLYIAMKRHGLVSSLNALVEQVKTTVSIWSIVKKMRKCVENDGGNDTREDIV